MFCYHRHRQVDQWSRIENSGTNQNFHSQVTMTKVTQWCSGKRMSSLINVPKYLISVPKLGINLGKKITLTSLYTVQKNQFQIDHRPKYER